MVCLRGSGLWFASTCNRKVLERSALREGAQFWWVESPMQRTDQSSVAGPSERNSSGDPWCQRGMGRSAVRRRGGRRRGKRLRRRSGRRRDSAQKDVDELGGEG